MHVNFYLLFITFRLRNHKIPFRFVTNESMSTRNSLARKLQSFGFKLSEEEIFCPGIAASLYINENKLRPYLLVHPGVHFIIFIMF